MTLYLKIPFFFIIHLKKLVKFINATTGSVLAPNATLAGQAVNVKVN
jgi:hypothetical protein